MDNDRRNVLQVTGAAVLGALGASSNSYAQQPKKDDHPGPTIVLAGTIDGKSDSAKGFKFKAVTGGYEVTFEKELAQIPVVLAVSNQRERFVTVTSITKGGFAIIGWSARSLTMRVPFSFIVVLS